MERKEAEAGKGGKGKTGKRLGGLEGEEEEGEQGWQENVVFPCWGEGEESQGWQEGQEWQENEWDTAGGGAVLEWDQELPTEGTADAAYFEIGALDRDLTPEEKAYAARVQAQLARAMQEAQEE